ncbi:MAG: EAL domain-containing protein [Rhodospirillales bacterium]|nr:EAL domain-containing protein [Rhodospirillales bacterium]MDH3909795.1 EAL domain-containing protein [Rhodospirillales bacterium]MDH3918690.1 EAL domain-containing protein [Rhodospirillales bacterium]
MNETAQQNRPHEEKALLDYAKRLDKFRAGRRALHVHFSRLRPYNRRRHHLRIAASAFEPLIAGQDGALFRIHDDDMILVCKDISVAELDECVLRLRYLFSEDPLLTGHEQEGEEFCTWYKVETDYLAFLSLAEQLVESRAQADAERAAEQREAEAGASETPSLPLDPPHLAAIIRAIAQADLSSVMRRQPVCAVSNDADPKTVFHEFYISIEDLRQKLLPSHDILANRWLFQDLTRHLDNRMIAMLARNDDKSIDQAFSINLNIDTLLSPEFIEFDKVLNGNSRRTIVVELQLVDVFADIGSFLFARDFLHGRGYKLCLDGTTHLSLPFVDRKQLGFDLIKLKWSSDLADQTTGARGAALRAAIALQSSDRIILCHSDSETALEVGRSLGITMFQGHYLDHLLLVTTDPQEMIRALGEAKSRHRAATRRASDQRKTAARD